jgi:hypothetical protein
MNKRFVTLTVLRNLVCAALSAALLAAAAARVSAQTGASLTDLLGQLKTDSTATGDAKLKSLGNELSAKSQSLDKSLASNPTAQTDLTGALQSLLGNKGGDSVAAFQKLAQAKLTPEQTKLAKDVGNLGSAYLVQKNLGSLEGSQSDVAQIVGSLRKGSVTEAVPAIQKVSQNAKLTQPQKDLLTSIADKYAPGAGKVGDALKGVKGLPGFGK